MEKFFSKGSRFSEFIFQLSPIGVLIVDDLGKILKYNPFILNLFGMESEPDLQTIDSELFRKIGINEIFQLCRQKSEPIFSEINFLSKEKEFFLQVLFIPYEKTEKGFVYEGIFIDITRKKQNERKFEQINSYYHKLLSGLPPLATINQNYEIKYANESFLKEFNKKSEEIIGKGLLNILNLDVNDKKQLKKNLQKLNKNKIQSQEMRIENKIFGYSLFHIEDDIGIILRDITETRGLEKKIEELYSELIKLQETERQKIARELHDSVGQTILAAKLNLNAFCRSKGITDEKLYRAIQLIDQTSQELRDIYSNLYPSVLRELGLETALRSLMKSMFPEDMRIEWKYEILREPNEEIKLGIYRTFQEICTNIVKHSQANFVYFHFFSAKNKIFIQIDDNGIGFNLTQKTNGRGLGLRNIKYRVEGLGGNFEIYSAPSKGVAIQISLPFL